jgi:hypothetical protein
LYCYEFFVTIVHDALHRQEDLMTLQLDARPEIAASTARTGDLAARRFVVYGDFNCPWSYLAYRRAGVLAAAGVEVDWRAVEHHPWTPGTRDCCASHVGGLQDEMPRVLSMLLPGEDLPYDLAGFVPRTQAAVAAYAESQVAGSSPRVRRILFESFWMHGVDIGDARVLRTLLTDALRGSPSPSEAVREWGYPVDITGGPISTPAWRTIDRWAAEWRQAGKNVVPVVQVRGTRPVHGVDAVEWLGRQILLRELDPGLPDDPRPEPVDDRDLPDLRWVAEQGGRWLRRWQDVAGAAQVAAR